MKNLKRFGVVIVAVACACSTQQVYWIHPEKDLQQFEADDSYCLAQSRGTRAIARLPEYQGGHAGDFSSGWDSVAVVEVMEMQKTIHRQCMIAKGWQLQAE